jgi:hypothetical protein
MTKMKWYAGRGGFGYSLNGHHCVRLEDGTEIEVHPDTYEQQFHDYLERIGVARTSYSQIMQKAEQEWQAYRQVVDAFAEDTQQWLEYQGRGVFITRPPAPMEHERREEL